MKVIEHINGYIITDCCGWSWWAEKDTDGFILHHQNYKNSGTKIHTHYQGTFPDIQTIRCYIKKHKKNL
jgi:hypothetical protein